MALSHDLDDRISIDQTELNRLQQMLRDGNRLGMYLRLHELTGSQAALDMAEISSASGLRGGTAWALNEAYTRFVPGYPKEGVEFFSRAIAQGDLDLIREAEYEKGRYFIPTDLQMYEGAKGTWNNIGEKQSPSNPKLGDHYFPGLAVLTAHYTERAITTGDFGALQQHIQKTESWRPIVGGAVASAWEATTELIADNYNKSMTINDILEQRPDLTPRPLKSPTGDEVIVFENAQGKPEHITSVSAGRNQALDVPVSFAEKMADGLAAYNVFRPFNRLGEYAAAQLPTPTEIKESLDGVKEKLNGAAGSVGATLREYGATLRSRASGTSSSPEPTERDTPFKPRKPEEDKSSKPDSMLDRIIDRLSQAASQKDDKAMSAAISDYMHAPVAASFNNDIAAQKGVNAERESQAQLEASLLAQQANHSSHAPHAMRM
jgi:hypothetical protein